MNDKNFKRHVAYEVLVILGLLALLTYITRLWPILLLVILGIFIATLRLLFLSSKKVEPVKPMLALPPPPPEPPVEKDMQSMAYAIIQRRITQIVLERFPDARWIWENPKAKDDIIAGNPVFVLLNKAGGYRRCRVILQNLTVIDVVFDEKKDTQLPEPAPAPNPVPPTPSNEDHEDDLPENFGLIAFQWVEARLPAKSGRWRPASTPS